MGVGGQGVHSELRSCMMWLSQGAPREITGGAGRNGRVPQRGTNNSQEERAAEFSQGSEDFKG